MHNRIEKISPPETTPALTAKILKCPVSLIRRAIKKGKLSARQVGKFYLISKNSLWVFYAVYYKKVKNRWVLDF